MTSARIVYAGTPEFALPPLRVLHRAGVEIVAIYTQPDRKAGRGRKLTAGPVKRWGLEQGLKIEQPETLRDAAEQKKLAGYQPDLMVVTAYGLILPSAVLSVPRRGCINLHASILPRWRGAAPVQRAILAGDKESGVTLMQMDAGLDTGPILAKAPTNILHSETAAELQERLAELAATLLLDNLSRVLAGSLPAEPQQQGLASYAHKVTKEEAWIDWQQSAGQLANKVSAFNPWPMAQTRWREQVLRIGRAIVVESADVQNALAGQVLGGSSQGIDIACGQGVLRVLEVQLPGARMISGADFIHAHKIAGDRLG